MTTKYIPGYIPGNNSTFKLILKKSRYSSDKINQCVCPQPNFNKFKQGWNDPMQTENVRISNMLKGTLGGKITFGNNGNPVTVNYLGNWEGQPGGQTTPLRNKF